MKKFFSCIFIFIIFLVVLVWIFKAQIVSHLISQGSGVDVRIESLSLSLNEIKARNIVAHEPKSVTTLTFGLVEVDTDLFKLFNKVVTIRNLKLDDVTLISDPGKIDISKLKSYFKKKSNGTKSEDSGGGGQQYVIESIEATNVRIQLENPLSDKPLLKANIPTIRLNKINQGEPLTLKQVLDFLTKQFQKSGAVQRQMVDNARGNPLQIGVDVF